MLEHRAAVQQQLVEQDTEELRRFNRSRDRVLARLWEIADLDPEKTRNGMSAQVKALSMIIAIEGLIPDRRAVSAQSKPVPAPVHPPFYVSEWARTRQDGENVGPQPPQAQEDDQQEAAPEPQSTGAKDAPVSAPVSEPAPDPGQSTLPDPSKLSQTMVAASSPYVRFVPDSRVPFSIPENPFARRRW
jgi:hypothetical protein